MYLTTLLGFLTLVTGVLGFLGLGFGSIPLVQIFFYVLLAATIISFVIEIRSKRKKYYD